MRCVTIKTKKKLLAVLLFVGLVLACVVNAAAAPDTVEIDVTITAETPVYDAEGNQLGTLTPSKTDRLAVYTRNAEAPQTVRVSFYFPAGPADRQQYDNPDSADNSDDRILRYLVVLSPIEQAYAGGTSDAAAIGVEPEQGVEAAVSVQKPVTLNVWLDGSLIEAVIFERLQEMHPPAANTQEPEPTPAPTEPPVEESIAVDATVTDSAATPSVPDDARVVKDWPRFEILVIVLLALMVLLMIAGVVLIISALRHGSEVVFRSINVLSSKVKDPIRPVDYSQQIAGLSETARSIDSRLTGMRGDLDRLQSRGQEKATGSPPPPPDPDRMAADIANAVAGIRQSSAWAEALAKAGYHYKLVSPADTGESAYSEAASQQSMLACIWKEGREEDVYIIPSYNDAFASNQHWHDLYRIQEGVSGIPAYRIERPAKARRGQVFFELISKGDMKRR